LTTLILGFGNPDRQDDGVAWHVLSELMTHYGLPKPESLDIDDFDPEKQVHFLFQLQLLPELADEINQYERAVFIDAHTGAVPLDVNIADVTPEFQKSPLTHHLTTSSLLAIARKIHNSYPQSILVSIRGYKFGFSQKLSPQTKILVGKAVNAIQNWIENKEINA
jgi:hydrogenase maturation protease